MKKVLLSPIWSVLLLICLTWIYTINPSLIESIRLRYFDTLIINQPVQDNNIYAINIDEGIVVKEAILRFQNRETDYPHLVSKRME